MRSLLRIFLLFVSLSLVTTVAGAQWAVDGTPVSTSLSGAIFQAICSDGAGGAIIVFQDGRSGDWDIYAQRINAAGVPQWTTDGVPICISTNYQWYPNLIPDGAGGAIITWHDIRSNLTNDVYAQRVNSAGVVQWTANGVVICNAAGHQESPTLVTDGAGGAIITWQDLRNGVEDIFAQRVNGAGAVQWVANGRSVCTATGGQYYPHLVTDGAGGAVIVWHDFRNGGYDIYAQRINATGSVQWVANGVVVCTASNTQIWPALIADGAGGAIITWQDARTSVDSDVYAQRLNAAGTALWYADGANVCSAGGDQQSPAIVTDGAGGAIIAWHDTRNGFGTDDIYASRVSATGSVPWDGWGVPVCTASGAQRYASLVADGAGGAVIAWGDDRYGPATDLYAQRVNSAGVRLWTTDGTPVTNAAGPQIIPVMIPDGAGGAIAAWEDDRSSGDIYAQRVEGRYGYWGRPEPTVTSVADIRNDQGGKVKVNWTASGRDALNQQVITHYSIWRATDVATAISTQTQGTLVEGPSKIPGDFKGKAVWVQHAPATDYYWEWVGDQNALNQKGYSFSASTRADSTLQGIANHQFMVSAHTYNDFTYWLSNVVSAHSVDNLAPTPPLALIAQRVGNYVHLKWNRVHVPDLKNYSVYRKTSSGVTPIPLNFLSDANDTLLTDTSPPASSIYYIVTAYDVHANQSSPSNEAVVAPTTGVGNLPPITALTVLQNSPNPFTGGTELSIGLPASSDINVDVFDVAGRKVSTMSVKQAAAGWQKLAFSGRDDSGRALASGVYFYRVHANGTTVTRKMVITR